MRRFVLFLPVIFAGALLSGCETAGYVEGPVEYATRPDYRDVYRGPPPRGYDRYDRYGDVYDRPSIPGPRYYRPYGGPSPYYDSYERYDRY